MIVAGIPEPYATMVHVAVYSGLRVSELLALRWNDIGDDFLMVDERYSRVTGQNPKVKPATPRFPSSNT